MTLMGQNDYHNDYQDDDMAVPDTTNAITAAFCNKIMTIDVVDNSYQTNDAIDSPLKTINDIVETLETISISNNTIDEIASETKLDTKLYEDQPNVFAESDQKDVFSLPKKLKCRYAGVINELVSFIGSQSHQGNICICFMLFGYIHATFVYHSNCLYYLCCS